jgi:hypothetical protein
LSRLRFPHSLAALAALVAIATTLAACGGGDEGGGDSQQVLDAATLQGIDSGNLDLSVDLEATGDEGGSLALSLSGAFQGEGKGELPQLDMTAKASGDFEGEKIDFDGGLVLLPNSAYVSYEGIDYEVDPTTFSFVEQTIKQQQRESGVEGGSDEAAACQEAVGELKVGEFVDDASSESSADVGGVSTTKVSGDLDVSGAIDSLVEVAESPACRNQLAAAGPLPSESEIDDAKSEVQGAVKSAQVDVYVGDDDIVRRVAAKLTIEPQDQGNGPSKVDLSLDMTLTGVNEEQQISAPAKSRSLSDLFIKLGVNPIELLGLLQGEGGSEGLDNLFKGLGIPGQPGSR